MQPASLNIPLAPGKKFYFLSDLHLGAPDYEKSRERERKLVRFLDAVELNAQAIFLVGDVFDFWFEYKHVVPKGFLRILSKLARLKDKGIDIYIFPGNHDLWLDNYLEHEIGAVIFKDKAELSSESKSILLAHGDGLGPGDIKYKFLKKIFSNRFCRWLFKWLHPDLGVRIAKCWSRHSFTDPAVEVFHGEDREWLIHYCKKKLDEKHYDYFLMGHRHLPMDIQLNDRSRYINLGDWILNCNYAEFDGEQIRLVKFEESDD
jgi:UDP-2,3-diacylglucosamine hydrolase